MREGNRPHEENRMIPLKKHPSHRTPRINFSKSVSHDERTGSATKSQGDKTQKTHHGREDGKGSTMATSEG